MNDNAARVIEQLAAKLGVAADHLWAVLLRQAPIEASLDLLIGLTLVPIASILLMKLMRKALALPRSTYGLTSGLTDAGVFGAVLGLVVCAIIELAFVFSLSDTIAGFFNPEYWALHRVLSLIGH